MKLNDSKVVDIDYKNTFGFNCFLFESLDEEIQLLIVCNEYDLTGPLGQQDVLFAGILFQLLMNSSCNLFSI